MHKREGGLVFLVKFDEVLAIEMVEKRGSLVISVSLARETIYLRRTEGVKDWFMDIKEGVERSRKARASSLPLLERGQERITLEELTMLYKDEGETEDVKEGEVQKGRVIWDEVDSGNSSLQSTSSASTFSPPTLSGQRGNNAENKENKVDNWWAVGRRTGGGKTGAGRTGWGRPRATQIGGRGLYVNTVQISHV